MMSRLLGLGLFLLLAAGPPGAVAESEPAVTPAGQEQVTTRWGVGFAYGAQWYGGEGESGTSGAVQLLYRADIRGPRNHWLIELGLERARSISRPAAETGEALRLRSTGAFYRLNRYIGSRVYLGGRIGFSRVRGLPEDEDRYIDTVIGLQGGVRVTSWLDAGIELVAADPEIRDGDGFPAELRGVIVLSY